MIRLKRWISDFFRLPHAHVNGFMILIPLLVLILFSEPAWQWYTSGLSDDFSGSRAKLDSLAQVWEVERPDNGKEDTNASGSHPVFFSFNPNKASEGEFRKLGFPDAVASRIVRYREKGGKFTIKSDLLKIYGLDTSFYQKLYSFIILPGKKEEKHWPAAAEKLFPKKTTPAPVFDLNEADTAQLKKIYGIGDRLSVRIIKYRDALGGFVTMDQVQEVYGLDSLVVGRLGTASFVRENFQPFRININTANEATMAAHPYLRKSGARAITTYRFQHGEFKALEDLRKIQVLDDKTIEKITPYLTIDE